MEQRPWTAADMGPPPEQSPPPDDGGGDVTGDVVKGGATGAVGGPWGALIGAAAGLIGGLMNNQAAKKRQEYEAQQAEHVRTANALNNAQQSQINTVGNMGQRENNSISQLLGAFARAR